MNPRTAAAVLAGMVACSWLGPAGAAEPPDTVEMRHDPRKYGIVVSATRTRRDPEQVPNAISVIRGEDLRRAAVATLAEALEDVVGLDTGEGSDNGMRLPNIGLWGLKEFDALLVTLDGVPVGGPFNPSLSQIPVDDIDRIEIVKGPQGTLYGVSAFAGMIQVFTRDHEPGVGHAQVYGGSFSTAGGTLSAGRSPGGGTLRALGEVDHSDGWQDRTGHERDRGSLSWLGRLGRGSFGLSVSAMWDRQDWGTPLAVEDGELVPGIVEDRNYAVGGARLDHHLLSSTSQLRLPLSEKITLENTLGVTQDRQISVRSFPGEIHGDTLESEGLSLRPKETTAYEDARLVSLLSLAGAHELVTGAALTWGKTSATGYSFDFDQFLSAYPDVPDLASIPPGENHEFEDQRTFVGLYAHDSWTPSGLDRLTLAGGARLDLTSEELETEAEIQPGGPDSLVKETRDDQALSGDVSALFRLLSAPDGWLDASNLYASYRTSFKPAAPNLLEAESAEILEPERTRTFEVGLKSRALRRQLSLDLHFFHMNFKNMVVSVLGTGGGPELVNAGEQRFRGGEVELRLAPDAVPGAVFQLGYSRHDARFVHFTFVTPDGELRDVSGKKLELVPPDLVNGKLSWASPKGPGFFVAGRYQSTRPLNRRNTFFTEGYSEWDAGISFQRQGWQASLVGRNLGDDRHFVTESDIGDSQFYLSAPRRFIGSLTYNF